MSTHPLLPVKMDGCNSAVIPGNKRVVAFQTEFSDLVGAFLHLKASDSFIELAQENAVISNYWSKTKTKLPYKEKR